MSARTLALAFAAACALALPALLPLSVALRWLDAKTLGLAAAGASGSVWQGHLYAASLRGIALGDARVALSPWSWLTGTPRLTLANDRLRLPLARGRRSGVDGADGTLRATRLHAAPGLALEITAQRATLLFADGGCVEAAGTVSVRVHRDGAADAAEAPPLATLSGPLRCVGRDGDLTLRTSPGGGALDGLEAVLRIGGDGRYRLQTRVRAADAGTTAWLALAGFQQGPGGWSREDAGSLLPPAP